MDSVSIASALIAARVGQAQTAMAAKLMKNRHTADTAAVMQLLAAAVQSNEQMAAAIQKGVGELVDVTV